MHLVAVPDDPEGARMRLAPSPGSDERERLADLVSRAARGYEDAFAELYDQTSARIYGLVLRVLRSPDHAAEVTQEVYVEIWRKAAHFDAARGSVMAWLTTIAHRRAVDRVRAVSSDAARDDRYGRRNSDPEVDHVWDSVEQRLDVDRVRKGLSSLTEIQREALSLAYFGGYTQAQVARLLDLPVGTVKTRIRDGMIGLRDALGVET